MGLFDRFKKVKEEPKEQIKQVYEQPKEQQLPYDVFFSSNPNGTLQVDFYDKFPEAKQFYDCTRLVVDPNEISMMNGKVLNAAVSWYGRDDAIVLDDSGKECGSRAIYRGILAQIDLNLLKTDPTYCYIVMKQLLKRDRVESYLSQGLEENPEKPCGKYIGGVERIQNGYRKIFNMALGRESHYSNFMVNRRQEVAKEREMKKQQQINRKQEEIRRLQEEIDNMR